MRAAKLLLTLLATLALPSVARAADWYVAPSPTGNDANTCAAGHPCATITHVIGLVGVTDGDTVHLAAGTYDENVQTFKRLTFAGAGAGTPASAAGASVIHSPGTFFAMDLEGGGSVQNLRVQGHDGNGTATAGLELESLSGTAPSYTVKHVVAIGGQDAGASSSKAAVYIDSQNGGSTLTADLQDLYAARTLGGGPTLQVLEATGGHAAVTLTRTTIVGGPNGRGVQADMGPVTLIDSTVQAASGSIGITTAGPLSIVRSAVRGGDRGVSQAGAGPVSIIDSLIVAAPTTLNRDAVELDADAAGTTPVLIRGSTLVVVTGTAGQRALTLSTQTGSTLSGQLVDSILRVRKPDGSALASSLDIQTFDVGSGGMSFTVSHSSFSSVNAAPGTTLPPPGSGTNLAGDPGFVSWTGGNYALAPTSPLIDRGDPAAITAGELDFARQPRSLDGNGDCVAIPDVGAYELPGHAGASHPTISGPALARPGQAVTFTATPASGSVLSWSFSGGGAASGPSVSHAFAATGAQTATVTATHLGCVGHASHSLTIDGTAPILSGVSFKKKKLRFKLSEAASVAVSVLLRKPHHKTYGRLGSFTVAGRKGSNSVKLPRKLRGHKLRAGRYQIKLRATDPAGNRSKSRTKRFTL